MAEVSSSPASVQASVQTSVQDENSDDLPTAASPSPDAVDLNWVWREVRKRVFIKMPFSLPVADAMAEATPIVMDGDNFIVGMEARHISMAPALSSGIARNTIENILRGAAGRPIHFEAIEGKTIEDWNKIKLSREKAQVAVIAMAERKVGEHHVEDVMSQIVSEIRQQISQVNDRVLPQVRASLMLEIAESLSDAQEMLFEGAAASHAGRRAMARVIDRVSNHLDVEPMLLAIEIERHSRTQKKRG